MTARQGYERALRAVTDQRERLRSLAAAADRLRACLPMQVELLEATALSVTARQAASTDEAATLGPIVDQLRDAGQDIHSEAVALAELAR